jgi:hypothetical protein
LEEFRDRMPYSSSARSVHGREVGEAALAHVVKNQVEAAYARSDLFKRRRELMEAWAEYILASQLGNNSCFARGRRSR